MCPFTLQMHQNRFQPELCPDLAWSYPLTSMCRIRFFAIICIFSSWKPYSARTPLWELTSLLRTPYPLVRWGEGHPFPLPPCNSKGVSISAHSAPRFLALTTNSWLRHWFHPHVHPAPFWHRSNDRTLQHASLAVKLQFIAQIITRMNLPRPVRRLWPNSDRCTRTWRIIACE